MGWRHQAFRCGRCQITVYTVFEARAAQCLYCRTIYYRSRQTAAWKPATPRQIARIPAAEIYGADIHRR